MLTITPTPLLKEGQKYAGEITREEALRLERSAQFCIPGLQFWEDYKPLLIYYDEVDLLDDCDLYTMEELGVMPESVFITHCCDDLVYATYEIEVCRSICAARLRATANT